MRDGKIFIIAEAGVNHNGSLERALGLVDAAAEAGADAVKFQTFRAEAFVTAEAPKAEYQKAGTNSTQGQLQMLKELELCEDDFRALAARCCERGIEFMSTAFDLQSLYMLLDIGLSRIKIPSGDVTNAPLLLAAGRAGLPVILSTGMCSLQDIRDALAVLAFGILGGEHPGSSAFKAALNSSGAKEALRSRVTLLHCTTEYPAPLEGVNLQAMDTLSNIFSLAVGYSDHSKGITVPVAAAARNAAIIEKHFTLDRSLPGPDHAASLEPAELSAMVQAIRKVELVLGDGVKEPSPAELRNMAVARKSLVAARPVSKGEIFTTDNLGVKRPDNGLSPMNYFDLLGTTAARDYDRDEPIGAGFGECKHD